MTTHRIERTLGVMAATLIVITAVDIAAILVGSLLGWFSSTTPSTEFRVLLVEPIPGLGLGFLLIIAFIIVSGTRRRREASRAAGQ